MKTTPTLLALALACAVPLSASETVRHFTQELSVDKAEKVMIDFPVGEVTITGADQRQVRLDVLLKCNRDTERCAEAAKAVHLIYRISGGTLHVEVKDWPKMSGKGLNVEARISVPRDLSLIANLGVGELNIAAMEADVDGDLGVGQLNVTLPQEAVHSVYLDTGIGESSLLAGGHRYEHGGLISRAVRWSEGSGHAKVRLDCGVGEIQASLK